MEEECLEEEEEELFSPQLTTAELWICLKEIKHKHLALNDVRYKRKMDDVRYKREMNDVRYKRKTIFLFVLLSVASLYI